MVIAGLQMAILTLCVQFDLRFFGGIQCGLTLGVLREVFPGQRLLSSRIGPVLMAAFLLPWLGIQGYYAQQFLPVVLGSQSMGSYAERYLAFYQDFVELDRLLPADAVLLVHGVRLDAVYAPRAVYFDHADVPYDRPVYFFVAGKEDAADVGAEFAVGRLVYLNPTATAITFRTPGRQPEKGPMCVFELVRAK